MKKNTYFHEWLGNYGWAILVVLILGGSLIYFGKLSPDNLIPKQTKIDKACEEQCADQGLYYKQQYTLIKDNRYQCHCMQPLIVNMTIK